MPPVHRLAALAEPVDVQDRGQVLEVVVPGVLERLPDRPFRRLAVAAQRPDPVRQPLEVLAGERHAHPERQPLAERAGGDVDPRDQRGRVAFEHAAERPVREQLLVRDRPGCLEHRVEQRRRVPLGKDEAVVGGEIRLVEVVAQVLREQHGHQVGGGHP
jgi:hypothetical protein